MTTVEGINIDTTKTVQKTDTQISYVPLTSGIWIIQGNVTWGLTSTGPLNSSISSSSISDVTCTVTTFANPRIRYEQGGRTMYNIVVDPPIYVNTYQTLSRTVTVTSPQNYYLICNSPSTIQSITGYIFYAIQVA
jgi:hypothetical protein